MTKKALLTAGILTVTSAAVAAERSRMGASEVDGAVGQPAPAYEMIEPNVAVVDFNGREVTLRANGAVVHAEVVRDHGSVGEFQRDVLMKDVPMARDDDGARVYANGAVGYVPEMIPASEPAAQWVWTLEDAKENMVWGEREIGGETVIAFANGVVLNTSEATWDIPLASQSAATTMLHTTGADGELVYADGRVVADEQPLADPSGN